MNDPNMTGGGTSITFRQMLSEARRETTMRRQVFSRMVERREMLADEADWKIRVMQAIADHLAPLAQAEEDAIRALRERDEPSLL